MVKSSPIITLLSDFGSRDAYVGIMKGVILGIAPAVRLVDLSHDVPAQNVVSGALILRDAVRYFPAGAIHVAVVDPGVGSDRHPVAVVTEQAVLVGPDNGLLHPAAMALGVCETRLLERDEFFLHPVSGTFHGRDLFAPVAAHLAMGVAPAELGARLETLQPLPMPEPHCRGTEIRGEVVHVDHFGNLVTNVPAAWLAGFASNGLSIKIGRFSGVHLVTAYAAVPEGAPLAVIGSGGLLEIAVRKGNAAAVLGAATGAAITVRSQR